MTVGRDRHLAAKASNLALTNENEKAPPLLAAA